MRGLVRFLQVFGEAIERSLPKLSILLDPLGGFFKRLRLQLHFVHSSIAPAAQQSGFLENAQMFRNCGQRHGVWPCQLGDPLIAPGEAGQDPAAGGVGQGGESAV